MKILQVPFGFFPAPVGGTEVYVQALAYELCRLGVESLIAAPAEKSAVYEHAGLPVCRFAVTSEVSDIRDLYGEGDLPAAKEFAFILDQEKPDIVHLHAFTRGVSLRLMRTAKARGLPVVFTYHTPTVSCVRGTLLQWGSPVCDGNLRVSRCAACTLHGRGVNKPLSIACGNLSPIIGRRIGKAGMSGRLWTALRMAELVDLRHAMCRALFAEVDWIVVLCQWTADLLQRNGVPSGKINMSRHGLLRPANVVQRTVPSLPLAQRPLRIAYVGRLDPIKGPDVLIRALRQLPEVPVELHLYGIVQGKAGLAYEQQLRRLAGNDPRIAFLPPVENEQVISLLREYHLVAVPSRVLETGPLVVLEAFAACVPVLGADLGGVAESVQHGVNGLLVEPDSVRGWCQAIQRCVEEATLLAQLRNGIRPPRGMDIVAQEMLTVYGQVLREKKRSHSGIQVGEYADASG
jgi:glycosyltransferase involved in cell wall biosynthesis